jgi:hypothetical protein
MQKAQSKMSIYHAVCSKACCPATLRFQLKAFYQNFKTIPFSPASLYRESIEMSST